MNTIINLYDLIFGFMRLGRFLLAISTPEEKLDSFDYNYIQKMKREIYLLSETDKKLAQYNTNLGFFYEVPLVLEDNKVPRSFAKHRINIVPINKEGCCTTTGIINNDIFLGTPGVYTNITFYISENLLKLYVETDNDSMNTFRSYISFIIEGLIKLVANNPTIMMDKRVYNLSIILINVFTKNLLSGSDIYNFNDHLSKESNNVWEVYRTIDKNYNFPAGLELNDINKLATALYSNIY